MALDEIAYAYSLDLPAQIAPKTVLPAATVSVLDDPVSSFELKEISERGAGSLGPEFVGSVGEKPMFSATTSQIAPIIQRMLDGKGVIGCMTESGQNCNVNYRKGSQCAGRVELASNEHFRFQFAETGVMTLQDISCTQNELARCRFTIVGVSDGVNPGAVTVPNTALTAAAAASGFYTLGPAAINSVAVPGLQGFDFNNNETAEELSADGSSQVDYHGIQTMEPNLTARFYNPDLLDTYGGAGAAVPAGGVEVYLRALDGALDGNHLALKTDPVHIRITIAAGKIRARQLSGSPSNVELNIPIARDSANDRWHFFEFGVTIPI